MHIPGLKCSNSYTSLPEEFFVRQAPEQVESPKLVLYNLALAQTLGLDTSSVSEESLAQLFSGNRLPEGASPLAQAYAGHQYGHFTMLGDGRALLLCEQLATDGHYYEIQLKGSGRTPYSRRGDGRAALGPMLREYIISEAMAALGIPSTRSLAVVSTGEPVYREDLLPGAVLTRVARSHIRVGTFEFAAASGKPHLVEALTQYSIDRLYPEIRHADNPALEFLKVLIQRQASLVARWLGVGFVHGVMNTDNMAVSGETIDYGPCAFIDAYDPGKVFSSIDRSGRYAFMRQPEIAQWNLARFAETLIPLLHTDRAEGIKLAENAIQGFGPQFEAAWLSVLRRKLGISEPRPDDGALAHELLNWMRRNNADYTNTFAALHPEHLPHGLIYQSEEFCLWHQRWQGRVSLEGSSEKALSLMRESNPRVIPRNHKVEQALEAAVAHQNLAPLHELHRVLSQPWAETPPSEYTRAPSPEEEVQQTFCGT